MNKIEKIRREIERRLENLKPRTGQGESVTQILRDHYEDLLSFVDTTEADPVSDDLEAEMQRYYVDWDEHPQYTQTARHFARWQKEQMLKNAIDAHVNLCWNSPSFGGFDWAKTGLYVGDKCKLIVVKED